MKFKDLSGNRITLIDLVENGYKSLNDMHEYSREPLFYEFMEYAPHKTIDETKQYLDKLINRASSPVNHYWCIFLKEQDKLIGTFGVINIDERKGHAEIGYGLSPNYWGCGYFNETLDVVLNHLFNERGFCRVSAITQTNNVPSINALKKAGFKIEGVLRHYYLSLKDNKRYDAALMGLLKEEFLNPN